MTRAGPVEPTHRRRASLPASCSPPESRRDHHPTNAENHTCAQHRGPGLTETFAVVPGLPEVLELKTRSDQAQPMHLCSLGSESGAESWEHHPHAEGVAETETQGPGGSRPKSKTDGQSLVHRPEVHGTLL